jgi:predicted HicB family RNase H-like nuclease
MKLFKYREYIGLVNYSIETNTFNGIIEGVNNSAIFIAKEYKDLRKAFESAVNEYINSKNYEFTKEEVEVVLS